MDFSVWGFHVFPPPMCFWGFFGGGGVLPSSCWDTSTKLLLGCMTHIKTFILCQWLKSCTNRNLQLSFHPPSCYEKSKSRPSKHFYSKHTRQHNRPSSFTGRELINNTPKSCACCLWRQKDANGLMVVDASAVILKSNYSKGMVYES